MEHLLLAASLGLLTFAGGLVGIALLVAERPIDMEGRLDGYRRVTDPNGR